MSSSSESRTTGSTLSLETVTLKVNVPPGSGSVRGLAVLTRLMAGSTSVRPTVAVSDAVASLSLVVAGGGADDVGLAVAGVAGEGRLEAAAVAVADGDAAAGSRSRWR